MKKVIMFLGAVAFAICATVTTQATVAAGCGVAECGGGDDKCCSQEGATYYMTKKAPVLSGN